MIYHYQKINLSLLTEQLINKAVFVNHFMKFFFKVLNPTYLMGLVGFGLW
jgi:hypothetical protein